MTQPVVGEDEAPVNAPKWTTAGIRVPKDVVQKYTHRNIASSPKPTAPSTAPMDENPPTTAVDEPTATGPSTADVFFLNENILVDDNVLDVEESGDDDNEKSKEDSSSEESSSGEEEDDNNNKGKDKEEEEDDDSSSSEEEKEEEDRDKGREGNKEEDNKDDEDAKEGDRGISVQSLLND